MRGTVLALVVMAMATTMVGGCLADAGDPADDAGDTDASAGDVTAALSARAGDTTISVDRAIVRRGNALVLHGRTSRTLTYGNAFIADDPFGTFDQPSARTFDVSWAASEATMLLAGEQQFIGTTFVHSTTRPDAVTSRVILQPALASFTGSTKIYLLAAVQPVVEAGLTVYRITGHTSTANTEIDASIGTVTRVDAKTFTIDVGAATVLAAAPSLTITAQLATGGVQKTATLGLQVASIDATTNDDVYATWPAPACTATVTACLAALPDGALDTASCGRAAEVRSCGNAIGVKVDAPAIAAALAQADTVLAADHADAVGLVGAARATAWTTGARALIATSFDALSGRWLLSATARDRVIAAARDAAIDTAYARPLALVPATAAVPGSAAAMRNVAADAVLATIATQSFAELGRTVEQLAHDLRAQHVADIRAFRETIAAQPYPGTPANDYFEGSWLGLHTEVVVVHATGAVVSTLVEID